MGFGFNLGMIFIVLPLTGILFFKWLLSNKRIYGLILGSIWLGIICIVLLSLILRPFFETVELDSNDYYGTFVIDRSRFSGEQADWQYNHFRFTLTENDSIFFYVTDHDKVLETYKGSISFRKPYSSARLVINMEQPIPHVLSSDPTTFRNTSDFYLVFYSPKFRNMFFKKGDWTMIE